MHLMNRVGPQVYHLRAVCGSVAGKSIAASGTNNATTSTFYKHVDNTHVTAGLTDARQHGSSSTTPTPATPTPSCAVLLFAPEGGTAASSPACAASDDAWPASGEEPATSDERLLWSLRALETRAAPEARDARDAGDARTEARTDARWIVETHTYAKARAPNFDSSATARRRA